MLFISHALPKNLQVDDVVVVNISKNRAASIQPQSGVGEASMNRHPFRNGCNTKLMA